MRFGETATSVFSPMGYIAKELSQKDGIREIVQVREPLIVACTRAFGRFAVCQCSLVHVPLFFLPGTIGTLAMFRVFAVRFGDSRTIRATGLNRILECSI